MSPALAGRFLTTEPPGNPSRVLFFKSRVLNTSAFLSSKKTLNLYIMKLMLSPFKMYNSVAISTFTMFYHHHYLFFLARLGLKLRHVGSSSWIKPKCPALEVWSLNHWTTREVLPHPKRKPCAHVAITHQSPLPTSADHCSSLFCLYGFASSGQFIKMDSSNM